MKRIKNELYFIGQTIRKERIFFSTTPFYYFVTCLFSLVTCRYLLCKNVMGHFIISEGMRGEHMLCYI